MKIDIQKTVLQESEQTSLLEELIPDMQKLGTITKLQEFVDEIEKDEEEQELDQVVHNNELLLGIITEQAQKKRIWQIVTACLMIFVVAISFIGYGFYIELGNQIEKVSQANANVKEVSANLSQASQEVKTLENQLLNSKAEVVRFQNESNISKAELVRLQNELNTSKAEIVRLQNKLSKSEAELKLAQSGQSSSKSEVKNLQNQLADTRQRLKALQNRNDEAVKRLNKRLRKLPD